MPMRQCLVLVVACLCGSASGQRAASTEASLLAHLFDTRYYSPYVRPRTNESSIVKVSLELDLRTILQVHEITSEITLIVWFGVSWVDSGLRWEPADWQGINHLHVPAFWLWLPDLLAKEMVSTASPTSAVTYYRLHSDGTVQGYYPQIITLHCRFAIGDFPFDSQTCLFKFGSFAYPLDTMTLQGEAHQENLQANPEWEVHSWEAENQDAEYEGIVFSEVHYTLKFARNSDFYVLTLIIPSSLITTLSVLGTFSPYATGLVRQERVYVGMTIFLTMSVLLMVVAEETPKSDAGYPVIGQFFFLQLMLIVLHSVLAVIIMYINVLGAYGVAFPDWLRCLICHYAGDKGHGDDDREEALVVSHSELHKFTNWSDQQKSNYNAANRHLCALLAQVLRLRVRLEQSVSDAACQEAWNRLCFVLDLVCMIVFLIIQLIITIVYTTAPAVA